MNLDQILTAGDLLTPVGIALVTTALVAIGVKPVMSKWYPIGSNGERPDNYAIFMNLATLGIAEVLAFLATFALNSTTGESLLSAFLVGVAGAVAATGIYEPVSNGSRAIRSAISRKKWHF